MGARLGTFRLGTLPLGATNYTITITQAGLVSPTGRLGRDSIPTTVIRSGLSSPKAAAALDAPTGRTGLVSPTEKAGKS